jgi:K+-sensing histidine kinase KdpD
LIIFTLKLIAKGQRLKPEQIVTLLRQIDVLTTNGKTLAGACKEVGTVKQSYYRWRKIYGGMKVDGSGIGLWLSKNIINRFGGVITAYNVIDGGAWFVIELPSA